MVQIGVLTLSDKGAKGQRVDESGPVVRQMLEGLGQVVREEILPDETDAIVKKLVDWVDNLQLDLVVTTGGTGLSPRDVTPQATLQAIDYGIPGMAEMMRAEGLKKTAFAILSRAVVGVRRHSLIINLPGSPKAARENLTALMPCLPHALDKLGGDPSDCAR